MKNAILFTITLLFGTAASAATWSIDQIEHGLDGGFGFSTLHDASGSNAMSGDSLATITHASGTYDDISGAVDFLFTLDNGDELGLIGNLLFDAGILGILSANSSLAYTGLNSLGGISNEGDFWYRDDDVCCNGSSDPNSFKATASGSDLKFMTLWGADGTLNGDQYSGATVGIDFRVEMSVVDFGNKTSVVPVPAAIWLFGTAFIGLVGFGKRKSRFAA